MYNDKSLKMYEHKRDNKAGYINYALTRSVDSTINSTFKNIVNVQVIKSVCSINQNKRN